VEKVYRHAQEQCRQAADCGQVEEMIFTFGLGLGADSLDSVHMVMQLFKIAGCDVKDEDYPNGSFTVNWSRAPLTPPRTPGNVEGTCAICHDHAVLTALVPCGHTFCTQCTSTTPASCPTCRGMVTRAIPLFVDAVPQAKRPRTDRSVGATPDQVVSGGTPNAAAPGLVQVLTPTPNSGQFHGGSSQAAQVQEGDGTTLSSQEPGCSQDRTPDACRGQLDGNSDEGESLQPETPPRV